MNAEYIQLCREANLPREWQWGDLYVSPEGTVGLCTSGSTAVAGDVWLPREGDLLDLLEAEGWRAIHIEVLFDHEKRAARGRVEASALGGLYGPVDRDYEGYGPDRCTALLRLLLAVRP